MEIREVNSSEMMIPVKIMRENFAVWWLGIFFRNCGRLLRRHFSNLSLILNGFQTPLAFLSGLISMAQSGMFIRINYSEKEESLTFMQFHPQESLVIRVDENDLI